MGQIEVTDITEPIAVAVNKDVPILKILIMNGSVEDKTADVQIRISDAQSMIDYRLNFVASQAAPCLMSATSDPTPYTVNWQGNAFFRVSTRQWVAWFLTPYKAKPQSTSRLSARLPFGSIWTENPVRSFWR